MPRLILLLILGKAPHEGPAAISTCLPVVEALMTYGYKDLNQEPLCHRTQDYDAACCLDWIGNKYRRNTNIKSKSSKIVFFLGIDAELLCRSLEYFDLSSSFAQ